MRAVDAKNIQLHTLFFFLKKVQHMHTHSHANSSPVGSKRGRERKWGERRERKNNNRVWGRGGWTEQGRKKKMIRNRESESGVHVRACCHPLQKHDVPNKTSLSFPSLSASSLHACLFCLLFHLVSFCHPYLVSTAPSSPTKICLSLLPLMLSSPSLSYS